MNPSDLVDEIRRHVRQVAELNTAAAHMDAEQKTIIEDPSELQRVLEEALTELRALSEGLARVPKEGK